VSTTEVHKWDLQYNNNPNDTLTGVATFTCSCTLVISGPREEVLRLLYTHLPENWWPTWTDGDEDDGKDSQVSRL